MTTELPISPRMSYRHLYNFLLVLNEEQITKLRRVVVGINDVTDFSEAEIQDLEFKLEEKNKERS